MLQRQFFALGVLAIVCVAGCGSSGPARHPLRGSVTIDGVKLEAGAISLRPIDGNSGPAAVTIVQHGNYRFTRETGPLAGTYAVKINVDPESEQGKAILAAGVPSTGDADAPVGPKGGSLAPPPPTPSRLNAPQPKLHWELQYTVAEDGEDHRDFELTN